MKNTTNRDKLGKRMVETQRSQLYLANHQDRVQGKAETYPVFYAKMTRGRWTSRPIIVPELDQMAQSFTRIDNRAVGPLTNNSRVRQRPLPFPCSSCPVVLYNSPGHNSTSSRTWTTVPERYKFIERRPSRVEIIFLSSADNSPSRLLRENMF